MRNCAELSTDATQWRSGMTEVGVVYLFVGLMVVFVIIGALIPKYLPGLVRSLDSTVLKDEHSGKDSH